MAKRLKINTILNQSGHSTETVKTASEKEVSFEHKDFNDFISQAIEKEAGLASGIARLGKAGWKMLFGSPSKAITSTAVGTGGAFTGKHLYETKQAKDAIKQMQLNVKDPKNFVKDPEVDSIRVELNKKYKDLEGSKLVATPYGSLYLPKEYK